MTPGIELDEAVDVYHSLKAYASLAELHGVVSFDVALTSEQLAWTRESLVIVERVEIVEFYAPATSLLWIRSSSLPF